MNASVSPSARLGVGIVLAPGVVVLDDTEIGPDVVVGANSVLGKTPVHGRQSTSVRTEPLPGLVVGAGVRVGACAVLFRGALVDEDAVVGDQAAIREGSRLCTGAVLGRGSFIENDTVVGARTRIQANVYVTAYSVLEEDVFIGPGVIMANDPHTGRLHLASEPYRGPHIERGARIGAGAVLLPGVRIGRDALVGAGAVVLHDVPPETVVVGSPARVLRDVRSDELLP